MRVLIHPADTGACGHYRLIWPGTALAEQGQDVSVGDPSLPAEEWPEDQKIYGKYIKDYDGETAMIGIGKPPPADVLVVQRPLHSAMPGLAMHMRNQNCALVVELDDDFTSIHAQNVSFWATHPTLNPQRSVRNILATIAHADLVTVTTPALKQVYQKHTDAEVRVIPNYVPREYLTREAASLSRPDDDEGKLLLGWSGSLETHPQDLQAVGGAVARVLRENENVRLTIVGTGKGAARAFGTKAGGYILTTGWVPLGQYPAVMKLLDVGMVPLQMSPFNEGKSWLKGLEWAALGVPFVATPTQQYRALNTAGAGVLASNRNAWLAALRWMITDEGYRHDKAACGRLAAERLVLEDHLDEWMRAWREARESKSRSTASSRTAPDGGSPTPTMKAWRGV